MMPLSAASWIIQIHLMLALIALILGAFQLAQEKGGTQHRLIGRIWISMMGIVAISSFFIHELRLFGPFSPIHLLSAFTLLSLYLGLSAARKGNIQRHKIMMALLYGLGLVLTGLFTFMPGRLMYQIFLQPRFG